MATEQVNVRIDGALKLAAEGVLSQIGLTPSDAVRLLYNQIIMQQGLPFEVRIAAPAKTLDRTKARKAIQKSIKKNKSALDTLALR